MDGSNQLADAAARKAADRAEAMTPKAKRKRFIRDVSAGFVKFGAVIAAASVWTWRNTPGAMRSLMLFIGWSVSLGFLCTITAWELNNSGKGWLLIFEDWGLFAWFGGVAVAGWCLWAHRQNKEHARAAEEFKLAGDTVQHKKSDARARKWFVSTMLCGVITLFGVFSNLVSGAAMNADHAIEVEQDRAAERNNVSRLKRELANLPKPSGVQFTRETLASYLAEATGWELANLDAEKPPTWDDATQGAYPGPACNANLTRTRQRDLCKLASDIRAELKEAEEMQLAVDAKQVEIDKSEARVVALAPVSGAKHYQRMAELISSIPNMPTVSADFIQTWGLFVISVFGIFIAAIGWDSVGEKADERNRPRLAPAAPTSAKGA